MEQIRISVALASYNGEKYIAEQLASIQKNLSERDEIVVSDDGSTDGTREIVTSFMEKDARIRLVEGPRQGIIANFEHALKECRGEYLFLSDQDDVWAEDKVEKVMRAFEKEQVSLVIHDVVVMNETLDEVRMLSFFEYRGSGAGAFKNYCKNTYMGCAMALKREVLSKIFPIPRDIQMHDQWIGILSDYYYGKSFFLREPLLKYRRHEQNNSDFSHHGILEMIQIRLLLAKRLHEQVKKLRKR